MKINDGRPKSYPDNVNYNNKFAPTSIKVKDLNSMIYNSGIKVNVYKTLPCPNRKAIDSSEHEINCPLCNGTELIDVDPIETYAIIQNIQAENQFNPENIGGTWQEQTVQMTFISGIELLYFAKIELVDFTMLYYQTVQRQAGLIDVLKYPIHSVNALIDKKGIRYYPGTDFSIDGQNIKWKNTSGTNKPRKGTIYSVHYNTLRVFRAINALHSNRFSTDAIKKPEIENVEFNQQWVCRIDYLITRKDLEGNKLDPQTIFPPDGE
jgi:hypothetical protein